MRTILSATLALAAGLAAAGGFATSASALTVAKHPVAVGQSGATQVAWRGEGRHNQWRGNHGRHGGYGYGHRYNRGGGIVLRFGNSGGGGCYWLKRRALDTGSRYWWHRYNECRN